MQTGRFQSKFGNCILILAMNSVSKWLFVTVPMSQWRHFYVNYPSEEETNRAISGFHDPDLALTHEAALGRVAHFL